MNPATASPTSARSNARPVIPDILEEHLEEHGFLNLQRRRLLFSVEIPLRRLPAHDERIDAHWDGLVIGAEASAQLALGRLEAAEDLWERASAALAWLVLARPDPAAVAGKLAAAPPEFAPSWREAFRQCPEEAALAGLPAKNAAALPPHAFAIAVDTHGWHGRIGPSLARDAARHADAGVRAAFARVLPHSGLGEEATALLSPLLEDEAPGVKRRALWSAALLAPEAALERARRALRGPAPDAFAVRVLGLLGGPDDHAAIAAAAATDAGRPAAFWAFADLGTDPAVESLIRLLTLPDEELVKVAAEALELAVGRIARKDLEKPPTPAEAHAHWTTLSQALPRGAHVLDGRPLPWREEKSEEPMRWLWRSAIAGRKSAAPWLRREVPDGFFDALPAGDARPGE